MRSAYIANDINAIELVNKKGRSSNAFSIKLIKKMNKENLNCPICFSLIKEATITRCGHTFCFKCITKSIDLTKACPSCNGNLNSNEVFSNLLLNELIQSTLLEKQEKDKLFSVTHSIDDDDDEIVDNLKTFLATESKKLSLPIVDTILEIFSQRKVLLEAESITTQNKLLQEFLQHLLNQTEQQQRELGKKIRLIKGDIKVVENILQKVQDGVPKIEEIVNKQFEKSAAASSLTNSGSNQAGQQLVAIHKEMKQLITDLSMPKNDAMPSTNEKTDLLTPEQSTSSEIPTATAAPVSLSQSSTYKIRKQRIFQHFEDFVTCYYKNRADDLYFQNNQDELMITDSNEAQMPLASAHTSSSQAPELPKVSKSLDVFRENLIKFSKYSQLRTLSTLNYSNENTVMPSTIVSSIEFDKDSEYFAIAGVTKRIKIFDYYAAIRDCVIDIRHPINEMVCTSKISSVSWNSYFKELLASSDYEGIVTVYDVETRVRKRVFQEHDKRCWSVDFNEIDSKLLASGSDDARVKLWSIDCENSVATLEVKTANVCCVKFNPKSSVHLAFGSVKKFIYKHIPLIL